EEQQRKEYYYLLQERVKELSVLAEVSDILRSETKVEQALSRIVKALPEGLTAPELASVAFHYDGKVIAHQQAEGATVVYERQIDLLYKGKLKLIIALLPDEDGACLIGTEKVIMLNNLVKKIQLYMDNITTLSQLERSQSNLYSVFENTDVGYMLLTLSGDIVSFNRQVYRELLKLYGVRIVVGMSLTDEVLKENAAKFISHFISAKINHKASEYEEHYEYKGKSRYFKVSVFPVLNRAKECLSVCLTLKDITKNKSSEIESKRITSDLIVRNRDLEQFSFMI
ncbi:MAG: PAS domain S-box protein, partial [Chitinophagaceae bacterium]